MEKLNKKIKQKELINVEFLPSFKVGDDIHIIKERVVYEDDTYEDQIDVVKDYRRPFWTTKEYLRKYKDKKESELIKNLDVAFSTQSELGKRVSAKLGGRYTGVHNMYNLSSSPFLYGTDIDSRVILKRQYSKHYKEMLKPLKVGAMDVEVNTLTDELIIFSIFNLHRGSVALLRSYVDNIDLDEAKVKQQIISDARKNLPDFETREVVINNLEIVIFDKEIDMIRHIMQTANYLDIDILTAWNIHYEITCLLRICEENNVDMADIVHYDKIPSKYKYFNFKEGRTNRITKSGKFVPINIEERWHIITSTTNYKMLDAMATHRYVRVGGATVPGGYSLSNILKTEGIPDKLKFGDSEGLKGIEWHVDMVANHPINYITYNFWDSLSILCMDQKTKDISVSLPLLLRDSHYDSFASGPRKLVDAIFFFYFRHGRVLGTADRHGKEEVNLGLDDWIVTLTSYMVNDIGLKVDKDDSTTGTFITAYMFDNDMVSGYPSGTITANVSKDTTHRFIKRIQGYNNDVIKKQSINLVFGKTNAVEYSEIMFKAPSMIQMLDIYTNKVKPIERKEYDTV